LNKFLIGIILTISIPLIFGSAELATATFPGDNGKIVWQRAIDGDFEIFVMNADGTGKTNISNNPTFDLDPQWSPDGTMIVFHSVRFVDDDIYIMNADGSDQTRLTDDDAVDFLPTWSPDGTKIAFTAKRDGNSEIYVMNADGSDQTRLTFVLPSVPGATDGQDLWPSWSPDGTKIAFASTRDDNDEIYIMNADGSDQTNISNDPRFDNLPDWSPDGTKIVFSSNRDGGNPNIYTMKPDGTDFIQLTDTGNRHDSWPSWSPDGTKIVFSSSRDTPSPSQSGEIFEIYVMNADGTGQTRLTFNSGADSNPNWQPLPVQVIGGELIPIQITSLLLAGAQSFSWMIPVVLSVLGIGLFVVYRKSENS